MEIDKIFYTPQEISRILRISLNSTYKAIHNGDIPALRINNQYRISWEDIESLKVA